VFVGSKKFWKEFCSWVVLLPLHANFRRLYLMASSMRQRASHRGDGPRAGGPSVMSKSGSFENIEELSAELLAQQGRVCDGGKATSRNECDEAKENEHLAGDAEREHGYARSDMWIEQFVTLRDHEQSISEVNTLQAGRRSHASLPLRARVWPVRTAQLEGSLPFRTILSERMLGVVWACPYLCEREISMLQRFKVCARANLQVALPGSHSRWLFAVSWLCILASVQCASYQLWDVLCVPLGVGLTSLNYWRKVQGARCYTLVNRSRDRARALTASLRIMQPDYGWRRYVDIVWVQFAIYFSCYKAIDCAEPYRTSFYTALALGISFFLNACRLCDRPAEGRFLPL